MLAELLGFAPAPEHGPVDGAAGFSALVVGAGVSGMLAALRLRALGRHGDGAREERRRRRHLAGEPLPGRGRRHPEPPVLVLVLRPRLVDVLRPAPEVEQYLRDFADATTCGGSSGSAPRSRRPPGTTPRSSWTVVTPTTGEAPGRNAVVSAVGQLNRPRCRSRGLDFAGPVFHSALVAGRPRPHREAGRRHRHRRERDADRAGGRGEAETHGVPALAAVGRPEPDIFRRFASSALADADRTAVPRLVPGPARLDLQRQGAPVAAGDPAWEHPDVGQREKRRPQAGLHPLPEAELADRPDLLAKALPGYPPFGKRMLLDNGWFAGAAPRRTWSSSPRRSPRFTPSGVEARAPSSRPTSSSSPRGSRRTSSSGRGTSAAGRRRHRARAVGAGRRDRLPRRHGAGPPELVHALRPEHGARATAAA